MNLQSLYAARDLARHLAQTSECVPSAHFGVDACPACGARDAVDGLTELLAAKRTERMSVVRPAGNEDALSVLATLWSVIDQEAVPAEVRARVWALLS